MKLNQEIYIIPDNDRYILYAPLKRKIITINASGAEIILKIQKREPIRGNDATEIFINHLRSEGILDSEDLNPSELPPTKYQPIRLTLLPTSDCNLKCIYCYADSGTTANYLSLIVAKAAIDFVFKNAVEKKAPEVYIGFLGGGEPFLHWKLVQNVFEYAKGMTDKTGIRTFFGGVTNGMLSKDKVLWLADKFKFLSVSFDGMREIQEMHRPTKNSGSSFDSVMSTITSLNEVGFKYSVRSTISSFSVNRMPEIVDFFINQCDVKRIHFEPLFACGRCRTDNHLVPEPITFVENFKKCLELIRGTNVELLCSAVRLDTLTSFFCGAAAENFYITPEGYVSSCTEVSSSKEPLSEIFFIGEFDRKSEKFKFRNDRRELLTSRVVPNMESCGKCIAKWHCAGGCLAKAANTKHLFNPAYLDYCLIARELTEHYIKTLAHGDSILPNIEANYRKCNVGGQSGM